MLKTEWRFGLGWSEKELKERLARLDTATINFPSSGPESQEGKNWSRYYSENVIGIEKAGPPIPNGPFATAWKAVSEYQFSDPGIVTAHFRPKTPLQNRAMLLEIKVLGLRYLCGARVTAVRESASENETVRAFRYETLESHIEVGSEWFTLTKDHASGEIWFRIASSWRPGRFPNWWSRVGFKLLSHRYQLAWHRLAHLRLRELVGSGGRDLVPVPRDNSLFHTGAEINDSELWIFKQPSATERVRELGAQDSAEKPENN